ncbi:short chain dehydrogenase [Microbacterium sp. NPDC058345]|uniref:short chain dehydrogenase n=1 Tax=Microbacterium sp. NPDC058345 TaxID=3346455 RepID=UPI00366A1F43
MKVLVIGSTGHVGSSAIAALSGRHEVIEAGRSTRPRIDITDPDSVRSALDEIGTVDAVIVAAGSVPFRALGDLDRDDYLSAFTDKVLSQIDVARLAVPHLADRGSITLTTGILAREAIATGAAASMANGALESFVRAAAPELPRGIRINAVSPSVLAEATGYHDAFPGFPQVSSASVGQAFQRCVEGIATGQVLRVE